LRDVPLVDVGHVLRGARPEQRAARFGNTSIGG
jgi:hypothetical protein